MITPVGSIPASVELAHNVKRLSRLELPGAGQGTGDGNYADIGHITNKERLGTSILDVSDPKKPKLLAQLSVDEPESHSHKARVAGDVMIVNVEQNLGSAGRHGVDNTAAQTEYAHGGFKLYDISDRTRPKLISHQRTWGRGVHRFDMDSRYAYISTEAEGYVGNILRIYDIRNPARPEEVSKWWIPGQHAAGGETKTWPGRQHRLHHTVRVGDRLFAGCWHGGVRIVDVTDIRKPVTVGAYNYHPPFPEPSHTFMELPKRINGRVIAIAIDEEDHAHSAEEMARRRGRPHAAMWTFDITDPAHIQPLAILPCVLSS